MPLGTAQRRGLVEQVISQMRTAIADGEWPVGHRIPTEPELVTALGVGRNTLREAVRALAHAGLLQVRQGDGTYVRATSELSGALRRLAGPQLRESLELRRVLEVEAAGYAARRRTDVEAEALRAANRHRNALRHAGDAAAAVEADLRLHQLIVDCAHNALLAELYRGITETIRASVATTMHREDAGTGDEAANGDDIVHDELVAAIVDADPVRASTEAAAFLDELLRRHAPEEG